jgi:hypothetical protein
MCDRKSTVRGGGVTTLNNISEHKYKFKVLKYQTLLATQLVHKVVQLICTAQS